MTFKDTGDLRRTEKYDPAVWKLLMERTHEWRGKDGIAQKCGLNNQDIGRIRAELNPRFR